MGRLADPATLENLWQSNGLIIQVSVLISSLVGWIIDHFSPLLFTEGIASSSALGVKLGPAALSTNRLAVSHSGGEEGTHMNVSAISSLTKKTTLVRKMDTGASRRSP